MFRKFDFNRTSSSRPLCISWPMITTRTLYSYTWNSFAREIMMMMMADAFFRETKMTRATASLCAVLCVFLKCTQVLRFCVSTWQHAKRRLSPRQQVQTVSIFIGPRI